MFPFSKKNFQNKKEKKKKAGTSRRTIAKPKGNGISPEGWQGKAEQHPAKPPYVPCHYAVMLLVG